LDLLARLPQLHESPTSVGEDFEARALGIHKSAPECAGSVGDVNECAGSVGDVTKHCYRTLVIVIMLAIAIGLSCEFTSVLSAVDIC
jgi:hypothetical protein